MKQSHISSPPLIGSHGTRDPASAPFFSIGVTTYNRPELLKQTLATITKQTFSDFEVIVGNDYTQEPLCAELLGIRDPRIRFVNRSQNLGEVRNMNALLNLARGRYFTWQCDDDLYAPNFLEDVHSALVKFNYPSCVFTSFENIFGSSYPDLVKTLSGQGQTFSGRQFLRMFWSGRLKTMGCTGVYDRKLLKHMGGVESLADTSFALYSEHLLLVRTGLLEQIAYINEPLVKCRVHEGSWGCTTKDLSLYKQAGGNLVRESITIFSNLELRDDFRENITSVLNFTVTNYLDKLRIQDGCMRRLEAVPYLVSLKKQLDSLKRTALYWNFLFSLGWLILAWWLGTKLKFKSVMTPVRVRFMRTLCLSFWRHR